MKIDTYLNLERKGMKNGDTVWACAYKVTFNKEGLRYIQKPVKGVLTSSKNKDMYLKHLEDGTTDIRYFVPFKKDKKDLAWSKAVQVSARIYATTKEECIELYNEEIQYYIDSCFRAIDDFKRDMI